MTPTLSIIIPGYNRPEPLKYTLRSVSAATAKLNAPTEVLLVDDGSQPSLETQLAGFDAGIPIRHLRQANQGSIVARQTGLSAATGTFVHFLDSDDLVHPEKYLAQVRAHEQSGADVTYDDFATATLGDNYSVRTFAPAAILPIVSEPARLFLEIQPSPHAPLYRREFLTAALAHPVVAPRRAMDPAGDVWLYYNLSRHPARIVKVAGAHTAAGPHEEDRYSRQWERLGVAALLVMEEFMRNCPRDASTSAARTAAGEAAFRSWRALPKDMHASFARRTWAIWQQAPRGDLARLGSPSFAKLAAIVGPAAAAKLSRTTRGKSYESVRTLPPEAAAKLFAEFDAVRP